MHSRQLRAILDKKCLANIHSETVVSCVILRRKATKNLFANGIAEILRFAQNDSG